VSDWDAEVYRLKTGFVSELGRAVVELLAPRAGERILDLGCGDGVLTRALADMGCEVVGIDSSPDMVRAARERGVDARLLDAAEMPFQGEFDAVFSNAALHWMRPPAAVVRGVHRALKPRGRFVAELGGKGNIANIQSALHRALSSRGIPPGSVDPWYFPAVEEYAALLRRHGFQVDRIEHFDRPTRLPAGISGWLESVARPFLDAVPADERPRLIDEVEEQAAPVLVADDGTWRADYVRLRVAARKPVQAV